MFRVLQRNLRHHIRIRELTTIDVNVCIVLQCQNPHLKSISNISESKNPPSTTVDYLINSCGLPPETALSASKKFRLKSTENPDSVLTFFKNHGLTKTEIAVIITKRPALLLTNPDKILKPKIEFLHDLGASGPILGEFLTYNTMILTRSLQNHMIPSFKFLKRFIGTNVNIFNVLKRSNWILHCNLDKVMGPNIAILQDHGVPDCTISKLLVSQPRTLMANANRFKEIVEAVKKMEFNLSSTMFVIAVRTMAGLSKSSWVEKLAVYQSLGFSDDEILSVFKKQPLCMITSEEKIRRGVEFFMKKLKWKRADLIRYPSLLLLKLEKRIIPRCAVLEILFSKGVIRRQLNACSALNLSEKKFLDKYVMKYHETIPEVMKAYRGEIEFAKFEQVCRVEEL